MLAHGAGNPGVAVDALEAMAAALIENTAPILEANALTPRSVLQIGQKLKIPKQAEAK